MLTISSDAEIGSNTQRPNGVHYNDRTYLCYLENGVEVRATYFDHTTDTLAASTLLHTYAQGMDSHGAPAINVIMGGAHVGKVVVAYCWHGTAASPLIVRVSTSAESTAAFGSEVTVESAYCTYPRLVTLSTGRIIVFYRYSPDVNTYPYCYRYSDDGGATWSTRRTVFSETGLNAYGYIDHVGDNEFHFLVMPYDNANAKYGDFKYAKSTDGMATWKNLAGTTLSSPMTRTNMDVVATTPNGTWDVVCAWRVKDTGDPRLLYGKNVTSTSEGGTYRYGRIVGGSWVTSEVKHAPLYRTAAGTNGLPCQGDIDPNDLSRVAVMTGASGTYAARNMDCTAQLEIWATDDYSTWAETYDPIDEDFAISPSFTLRAMYVEGAREDNIDILASRMTDYGTFTSYNGATLALQDDAGFTATPDADSINLTYSGTPPFRIERRRVS